MIAVANDHTSLTLKKAVILKLESLGLSYTDYGALSEERCDYPVFGLRAAKAVASGECDKGILLCGTGMGMALTANKVKGVRCCVCSEPYTALMSRLHNDANMIAVGSRVVGDELALMIIETFLNTAFEGGRHLNRVKMIMEIENDNV